VLRYDNRSRSEDVGVVLTQWPIIGHRRGFEMVRIDLLKRIEQWDGLADEWDALVADSDDNNPFRCWSWLRGWWTHFGAGRSLVILTAREHGRLMGIAPLFVEVVRNPFPVKTVRFLGGTDVCSEYLGLLIRQGVEDRVVPAILEFLLDAWSENWDVLCLTDIPADGPQVKVIEQYLNHRGVHIFRHEGVSNLTVRLPATWGTYLGGLSSRRRTKLRRTQREFRGRSNVEFEVVEDESQFERCWDELRMLHNRRRADLGELGCFVDPRFDAFHTELARDYLSRQMLLLASLRVDGAAIASCYGMRLGETVYEYQRGYDPAHFSMRPGHALQFFLFEHMIAGGVRCWDYLRGDYPHKHDWANAHRRSVDIAIPAPRRAQLARYYLERSYRTARSRLGDLRHQFTTWLHTTNG
jgi:CelD/BcsL family acetyltransferase involved in cellulose biosynthesis